MWTIAVCCTGGLHSGTGSRHLQGCYTDHDGLASTLRMLPGQAAAEAVGNQLPTLPF
ncbi:MAG: hypothetical protein R3F53_21590 [Gammaproteobacteria bacterium]